MKKVIYFFAAALICLAGVNEAQAQKQAGGEKNLEFNFAPLGGNPIGVNGIRFRYFMDESSALRVNLFVGSSNTTEVKAQEGALSAEDPTSPMLETYDRMFDLTIRPGYEIHFDGTDRLSPYVGAEIDFGIGNTSFEEQFWGPSDADDSPGDFVTWSQTETNPYTRFGLNLLAGFDFYFADNVYLGAEFGYGFSVMSMGDTTIETDNQSAWGLANAGDADADLPDPTVNGSQFNVGPNVNGQIRLGFLFN